MRKMKNKLNGFLMVVELFVANLWIFGGPFIETLLLSPGSSFSLTHRTQHLRYLAPSQTKNSWIHCTHNLISLIAVCLFKSQWDRETMEATPLVKIVDRSMWTLAYTQVHNLENLKRLVEMIGCNSLQNQVSSRMQWKNAIFEQFNQTGSTFNLRWTSKSPS